MKTDENNREYRDVVCSYFDVKIKNNDKESISNCFNEILKNGILVKENSKNNEKIVEKDKNNSKNKIIINKTVKFVLGDIVGQQGHNRKKYWIH